MKMFVILIVVVIQVYIHKSKLIKLYSSTMCVHFIVLQLHLNKIVPKIRVGGESNLLVKTIGSSMVCFSAIG